MNSRKYPVGIQSFESIRRDGYVYVDKTEIIYRMITQGKPYFLSRPRRFGKSLLVSTFAAIFEGRRELFEAFTAGGGIEQPALYIASQPWDWAPHPVLRFDFSMAGVSRIEDLDDFISETLSGYERQYGIPSPLPTSSLRMADIIRTAHAETGRQVAVLIDEYDNLMLKYIGDGPMQELVRDRFQNLFGPLKGLDEHLKFIFITGITKFSQMGIFSKLNQLTNISMSHLYETLCGITEQELTVTLRPDIERLSEANGMTYDGMLAALKQMYDGYHFSELMTDIYNPYSLFNAFALQRADNYWFASGTPSALIKMLAQMPPIELTQLDGVAKQADAFNKYFENYDDPIPVLYQSGYLTIKSYRRDRDMYGLGFPNSEVRKGFADCLYQHVAGAAKKAPDSSVFLDAYYDFRDSDDLPAFISAIQTFFAGFTYQLNNQNEMHYHALLYTLLVAFGADVVPEDTSAKGRADMVLKMPSTLYIFEIKYDRPADEALRQIDEKGYAEKYALDGRPVVKVGLSFSSEERNITEWTSEPAHATAYSGADILG